MDIQKQILNEITSKFNNQLESLIIQGLKLKGFEFENKKELEDFVKTRCGRTDNINSKEHIYYIDNTPFFLHKYEVILEPIREDNNGIKIIANYGSYSFL